MDAPLRKYHDANSSALTSRSALASEGGFRVKNGLIIVSREKIESGRGLREIKRCASEVKGRGICVNVQFVGD